MLGTFAVGIFAFVLGGNGEVAQGQSIADAITNQLSVQVVGIVATILWSAVLSWVILKLVDGMIGVRVTEDEETEGLDIVLHDETGYNL